MPTFPKGCRPPKDLKQRARLSADRNPLPQFAAAALPASYDCRTSGYVTPIKDQGQCGDCWNFSGTGIAEMASIIAGLGTQATVNWAEQSVLDCGSNGGCNGDWPETALEQAKNSGLANTSDYPYTGGAGPCKNVPHPNVISDYGYVGTSDAIPPVADIKTAMMLRGPISCAVAADDAFMNYASGVFTGSGSTEIDHAIILVGWQDDASVPGGGYWILRNSWNTTWGEQGYMRIAYSANMVGYGAMWATCSKAPAPAPVPPSPSPTPVPPTPPAPAPITLTGTTTPTTVTIQVPVGLLGRTASVPVPIPALAVTVSEPGAVAPTASGTIIALILEYGAQIAPVVIADIQAGKTWSQILADIAAALFPVAKSPCGCK